MRSLSATSGLPHTLARANMQKVATVLFEMPTILRGLMRGMDPSVLDDGVGLHDGVPVWYVPTTDALGVVLPSNSPGVNSLWIPSIALKVPVVLKPGREEPWTPLRIARAMIAAGIPAEAFSLYATDHEGAGTILDGCGARAALRRRADDGGVCGERGDRDPRSGGAARCSWGADEAERWRDHLDVLVASVSDNGGRSCINASAIFVPSHADEIAEALGERLASLGPKPHADADAKLSAFANPKVSEAIDAAIERGDLERRRRRDDREPPRRRAARRSRGGQLPAPDGRSLRLVRARPREHRVHVPLHERGRGAAGRDAREDRTESGRDGDHARPGTSSAG